MDVAIQRHHDAAHINAILNHPEVYPYVKGDIEGPLDLSAIMESEDVFVLMGEHGGQMYQRLQAGVFEAHSQFTPQGRGDWALEATRQSLHWLFTRTEAVEILTRCPQGNLAAKALARAIGGQFQWTNTTGWIMDGKPVPAEIWSLTIQDWMRTAPRLVERGQWFHERLEAEMARHGAQEAAHAPDRAHDRYVGAAVEMFFGGQPRKGAVMYNRFAALGGYLPIEIVETEPLAVDIGTAVLVMREDDFFIPSMPVPATQEA